VSRVVILSSQSIFTEGVTARLRQYLAEEALVSVDARRVEALAEVLAAEPSVVIVDSNDPNSEQFCHVGPLLNALPGLTIIHLDPQRDEVQVVTSRRRTLNHVQDLVQVINEWGD
jgi:hypothetical protein